MIPVLSEPPRDAHIAACGLFCTNCRRFKSNKCPGCQVAPPFKSCPVRKCCNDQGITDCGQCAEFAAPRDYRECKKLNNMISKVIGFFTGSDRVAACAMLRDQGRDQYMHHKAAPGKM
jgi:hypothetical protein